MYLLHLDKIQRIVYVNIRGALRSGPPAGVEVILNIHPENVYGAVRYTSRKEWASNSDIIDDVGVFSKIDYQRTLRFPRKG